MSGMEREKCEKCGQEETEMVPLIEVRVPLTDEFWMLCDPCIDNVKRYIDTDTDRSEVGQ